MENTSPCANNNSVIPHLVIRDAKAAIEFYKKAFGAVEQMRLENPKDGTIVHASVKIGNGIVMLAEENKDWQCLSPLSLNGSPVTVHLYVDDVDAVFKTAVESGAETVMPPDLMFWGDRYGKVKDPFGHQWSLATPVKQPTPEEVQAGMLACMQG